MNRDDALKKIKKCLALSRSANEHEAAAALRQAQALRSVSVKAQCGLLHAVLRGLPLQQCRGGCLVRGGGD